MFKSLLLISICVLVVVECKGAKDNGDHRVARSANLGALEQLFQELAILLVEEIGKATELGYKFIEKFIQKFSELSLSKQFEPLLDEAQQLAEEMQVKFSEICEKIFMEFLKSEKPEE